MNKRVAGLLIAVLLAGTLVAAISAAGGNGGFWAGAKAAVKVSPDSNVLAESHLALGPDNRVAVIWSHAEAPHGVFMAQTLGSSWTVTTVASTGNLETWNPVVAYSGTKRITAWTQGAQRVNRSTPRALMQKDEGLAAQTIITPVFGNVEIGLVVAPTGMHLIFAATTNTVTLKFPWDLYYTHRYFTATTWSPPTVVITHGQVIAALTPNMTASIYEPRLAMNGDGTRLYVVWQQEHSVTTGEPIPTTALTLTTWHISGTWQSGSINWATPQQVSPAAQQYTIRPNVVVGPTGKVHIVWTELIVGTGGVTRPDEQYINYRQLGGPAAVRINSAAIKVNNLQPTRAAATIAGRGNRLCVAWHGFYSGDKEEIVMSCSQNEGATWSGLTNVSESPTWFSVFPTAKIDAANQVHIAWTEFRLMDTVIVPEGLYYRTGTSDVTYIFLPLILRKA